MDEQRPGAWQANVRSELFLGDDVQALLRLLVGGSDGAVALLPLFRHRGSGRQEPDGPRAMVFHRDELCLRSTMVGPERLRHAWIY